MPGGRDLEMAVQEFGIGALVDEPRLVGRAWSNQVWQVRTVSGSYAVKLFPQLSGTRRRELDAGMRFERLVLEDGRIPVPQPVSSPRGWLVELPTRPGPRLARCHRWVPGVADSAPSAATISAAGRYLGWLHALRIPGGNTSGIGPVDLHRWRRDVDLARKAGLGWADRLADLTATVEDLARDLDVLRGQRRPMLISHRDYDPKNTVIDADGRLVIADWDYAGPVLPAVELIVAATSFAGTDDQVRAFAASYREAAGGVPEADPLAMTAELCDLDWLLRNVEACLHGDPAATGGQYATAEALIESSPSDIAAVRAWPQRLPELLAR